ncbi:MAG: hypothetical protein QNJ68_07930 [Microcoleaceae cyanobacterium MO_207.B10]|nr:hypothetical protein [Microcoleaceae cyanobacterium MO_207.B10]
MPFGLGYYGASDETNRNLDYEGNPPKLSESAKQKIHEAIAEDYPQIKNCSDRDKKAITKWVVNEHDR